jgi:CO/xanthine dehydrogenase Mo-binding subunit
VLPPVPAAIGKALQSLVLQIHELPITPERVLEAFDSRDGKR